jgi:hypothetical protein
VFGSGLKVDMPGTTMSIAPSICTLPDTMIFGMRLPTKRTRSLALTVKVENSNTPLLTMMSSPVSVRIAGIF